MVMQEVPQWIDLRLHHDRNPNLSSNAGLAPLEYGRRHTHNGVRMFVDFNCLADNVWSPAEMRLPEMVADHGHGRTTRLLVFRRKKSAPQDRTHAQYVEIIRGRYHAPDPLRFTLTRQAQLSEAARRDARETLLPVAHGFQIGVCKREGIVPGLAQRHRNNLARIGKSGNWI